MGGIRLARTRIAELRKKIAHAYDKKKEFSDYLHDLKQKYHSGEISYSQFLETFYKKRNGLNLSEWIEHFDDYVKDCRKEIKKQRINLVANHIAPIFFAFTIVTVISLVVFFVQPKFSGFSVDEPDSDQSITDSNSEEIPGGDLEPDPNPSQTDETFGEEPLPTSDEILEENKSSGDSKTVEINETSSEIKNESQTTTSNESQTPLVNESFANETAISALNESQVQNNESQIPEIAANETLFNFTEINETASNLAIANETLSNITIIENAMINTTQSTLQIKLGEPVKWKKTIYSEETGNLTITLPDDSENIAIKKVGENEEDITQSSSITGAVVGNSDDNRLFKFLKNIIGRITGRAIDETAAEKDLETIEVELSVDDASANYEIEYETPAPYAIETEKNTGKDVKIVGPDSVHYENVLAFTNLNENLNVKNPNKIRIHWIENDTWIFPTSVKDSDSNGVYDYIEWNVPHLSEQTFEIIVITKAEHLDENKEFISDIYEKVKALDGIWSEEISENHFVRVKFEKNLTNENDITIYPRITSGNPRVEIYERDGSDLIAEFSSLNENEYNKVFLTELGQGQCYDKETEILTENGWKFFNEMTKEEKVMTLNQETGKQEWKLPTEWQEFDNPNGELYKIELEDGNELRVSEKHKIYASYGKDYLSSIMSSNSLGENTLTSVCFLRPLSPENIGQPYSIASARYGASLKFSSIAFDNLFKNPEDGTNVICFFMNSSELFNSSFESRVSDNNLSIFLSSSDAINSGAMNSNLLNSLLYSNTSKLLPFFISAENTTFTSTTRSIGYFPDFNNLEYLSASDKLTSSDNFSACSSVNFDLETIRFIRAISSNSSFTFFDSNNCQFIFFANSSSLNSSGSLMVISPMENTDDSNYINLPKKDDFSLILVTDAYEKLQTGSKLFFLDENNKPIKVK